MSSSNRNSAIDEHTFLALHRAHASLSAQPGTHPMSFSPSQTIFTALPTSANASSGYPLTLARATHPSGTHLFAQDWSDLARSARSFVFDRVLVADRGAAERGVMASFDFGLVAEGGNVVVPAVGHDALDEGTNTNGKNKEKDSEKGSEMVRSQLEALDKQLSFAPAFALSAPVDWASPILEGARTIARAMHFLPPSSSTSGSSGWGLGGKSKSLRNKSITYVSTQNRERTRGKEGPRLREEDHARLVKELRKMAEGMGWRVFVVELGETSDAEVIGAAAASSVRTIFLFLY